MQLAFASLEVTGPLVRAGQIHPLAVASPARLPQFPEVPALAERIPGFECFLNVGIQTSTNTPAALVAACSAAYGLVLSETPSLRTEVEDFGIVLPPPHAPAYYGRALETEFRLWEALVEQIGLEAIRKS